MFARHPGQVLSREQLLRLVWGYASDVETNVVDVFVGYVRRKLEAGGSRGRCTRCGGRLGAAAMRLPGSLRARLTLAALLAVAIGGLIAGPLLLAAVERDGRQAIDRELRQQTAEVLRGGPGRATAASAAARAAARLLRGSGTFVQVAYGDEVVRARATCPTAAPAPPAARGLLDGRDRRDSWRSLTIELGGPATRASRRSPRSRRSTSAWRARGG